MTTATINTLETSNDEFVQELSPPLVVAGDRLEVSTHGGGLNTLYQVNSIGGKVPSAAVLMKTFAADSPEERQTALDRMGDLHRTFSSRSLGAGWSKSFLALPYQVFTVTLDGKQELATLMLDITALGYRDCPFGPNGDPAAYGSVPFETKVAVASSLLTKAKMLQAAGWIHADINPPNLMISGDDVQIIDFDSGTPVGSSRPPQVIGKGDIYTAPEVWKKPLPQGLAFDLSRMSVETDIWSCAMLVSSFLFLVPPILFLRHYTVEMIDEYSSSGRVWPDFDPSASYATTDPAQLDAHLQLADLMNQFTPGVTELFSRTFRAGSNGLARPTMDEWLMEVGALTKPLTVNLLTVSDDVVLEGDLIELEWEVEGADWVKINEHDQLPAKGLMRVAVTATTQYVLEAGNVCNAIRHMGPVVRAAPLPRVETIKVPPRPEFAVPGFAGFGLPEAPQMTMPEFPRLWNPGSPQLHNQGPAPGDMRRAAPPKAPPPPPPPPPRFFPQVGLGLRWLRS